MIAKVSLILKKKARPCAAPPFFFNKSFETNWIEQSLSNNKDHLRRLEISLWLSVRENIPFDRFGRTFAVVKVE